jgi:glycosyltransferase involved in cell wall biosynthesis
MRILQINQCHYPRGGADIVYLNHIELLSKKGHEVATFSTLSAKNQSSEYSRFFTSSIELRKSKLSDKILNIPTYLYNQDAYNKVKELIKCFKPDIAHVHLFYANPSISVLKALSDEKIPVLHTVHDFKLLCPVSTRLDSSGKICNECVERSLISCVTKRCSEKKIGQSIVVSIEGKFWKSFLSPIPLINQFHFVSEFHMQEHIKYIPEIASRSTKLFNFAVSNSVEPNKSKSENFFLFFGRLSYEKGIMTLILAWSLLAPEMKLKIVGDGPQKEEIINFIRCNNLKNIELLGFKKGEELNNLIRNSFFVIVPSECYENNPMTIIESYMQGTPVIGASIGGIPEIVIPTKTGFVFKSGKYVELKNVIEKANIMSDVSYFEMQQNCKEFAVLNFSEDKYYEDLMLIYNKTINSVK